MKNQALTRRQQLWRSKCVWTSLHKTGTSVRAYQEQWILSPRHSSRLTNGSGTIFLPSITWKTECLAWTISKKVTVFSRHRKFYREIDGAIYWCSLLLMPRRDFENEGAGTFSESQWLGSIHRWSHKPRFQFREGPNNNLLYIRAIQGHSGGELIEPEQFHLDGKSTCTTSEVHSPCTPCRAHRRWKRHQRGTADGLLHSSGPYRWWNRTTPWQVPYKNKWNTSLDAICWIFLGEAQDKIPRPYPLWLRACWLHWKSGKHQRGIESFLLRDLIPKLCWRMLGKCSTTKIYSCYQVPRNRVPDSKIHSTSISECNEYHRMQHLKIKDEWPRFKTWCILSELSPERSQWPLIYRTEMNWTRSVRCPKRPS